MPYNIVLGHFLQNEKKYVKKINKRNNCAKFPGNTKLNVEVYSKVTI